MKINLEFPDCSKKEFDKGVSGYNVALSIGERLGNAALAIEFNGKILDLDTELNKDGKLRIITFKDKEGKEIFRHSASHVMADAVKRLFPKAKLTIGPAIEDGFYYDIDVDKPFSPDDLEKIEAEIKRIVSEKSKFKKVVVDKNTALERFKGNKYKLELINGLGDEQVTVYEHGKFFDLCRGPHVPDTSKLKAIKLTKIAGAYWRGDAKNKQLQRIYGVAFPDKKELKAYLKLLEEAEKRDHRKLGKQLELFSLHDEGPGFPFFLPKGMIVKNELVDYWREEHRKAGYVEIQTPIMLNKDLWVRSGHWKNYRENMYFLKIDNEDFAVKPMNCPGGFLVYNETVHSYKELPLRVGELGLVHRHEMSGVLAGLFRVRVFTQDDAHIFMMESQIEDEVLEVIRLCEKFYKKFGFEYNVELSTRPEKSIGTDEQWDMATEGLKNALEKSKLPYKINEGDGAFYGPKIDFHLKDCLGRTWQCGTIQLDMSQTDNFDLKYMGKDGTRDHKCIMIHRTIYGSLERFMGILIEHYAGNFPLWLAPVQARILTIADRFNDYAEKIKKEFFDAGIRIEIDSRSESVNKKVREAQLQKVPIMLTVGEKELENKTVALRTLDGKVKFGVNPSDLMEKIKENIEKRDMELDVI